MFTLETLNTFGWHQAQEVRIVEEGDKMMHGTNIMVLKHKTIVPSKREAIVLSRIQQSQFAEREFILVSASLAGKVCEVK